MNFRNIFESIIKKSTALLKNVFRGLFVVYSKLRYYCLRFKKKYLVATEILLSSVMIMALTLGFYSYLFGSGMVVSGVTECRYSEDAENHEVTEVVSRIGSSGKEVSMIQQRLRELGCYNGTVSGVYDINTSKAVRKFQQKNGIVPNGVAGAKTLYTLGMYSLLSNCEYGLGSSGEVVFKLQERLSLLGYYDGQITGNFGCLTASAVRDYQKSQKMRENGIADFDLLCKTGVFCNPVEENAAFSDKQVASDISDSTDALDSFNAKLELLASFISYEAETEPYLVKLGIACVVINRIKSDKFPDTVSGVIRELTASAKRGNDIYFVGKTADESSYNAAYSALSGCNCDPSGGALYYRGLGSYSLLSSFFKKKQDGISGSTQKGSEYIGKLPVCRIFGVDFYK